jgi:hypothetical protein
VPVMVAPAGPVWELLAAVTSHSKPEQRKSLGAEIMYVRASMLAFVHNLLTGTSLLPRSRKCLAGSRCLLAWRTCRRYI